MTETTNSIIKSVVMSRVRSIRALQMLLSTITASVVVLVVSLWGIGREVWVSRVIQDMPSLTNVGAVSRFYLVAFMDTRFVVQALSLITVAAFVWFVYNAIATLQQASHIRSNSVVLKGAATLFFTTFTRTRPPTISSPFLI